MALPSSRGTIEALSLWALLVAVLFSAYVVVAVRGDRRPLAAVRSRLLLGVPWGTMAVLAGLLCVYYLAQGAAELGQPVVVGFRSWSYTYPLGMVLGPFAHSGLNHLIGNVVSTVAFAPVAEYAWSHYPTGRGASSFSSLRTNPFARATGFVIAVFLVGLATSLFIPGALIGFSGVVFAFAGFALVTRPVLGVFALLSERVVRLLYFAVDDPVLIARGRQQFVTPYWADVAVQGHALGLLLGVLLGLAVARRRDQWPDVGRVWLAFLVYGVAKSLWAFYWYLGGTEYVLFRGVGLAVVAVLAGLVAAAVARRDSVLLSRIDLSRREAATGLLVAGVVAMGVAAVPYNTVALSGGPETGTGIQVRDYTVTYAEDIPNRYVGAVEIPFLRDAFSVNASGVVVSSERRNAWEVVAPAGTLKVRGRISVPVGGLGWRETVVVNRTTWSVIDGGATYKVYAHRSGQARREVFRADPAVVPAIVNDSRIAIRPSDSGYRLAVARNDTVVDTGPVPPRTRNVTVGDIRFNRTGGRLRASYGGTRVPIAKFQTRASGDR
jgi:membrane associated rhomboid family serine protease